MPQWNPQSVEESGNVLVFERRGDLYSLHRDSLCEILCAPQAMNVNFPVRHWKKGSYLEEAMNSASDGRVLLPIE